MHQDNRTPADRSRGAGSPDGGAARQDPAGHGRGPCCCFADHLTEREVDVLCNVAAGLTNDEVAAAMNISGHTVAGHLRSMLNRTRARSRAELVARAYTAGVLLPEAWPPARSGRRCLQPTDGEGQTIPGPPPA